MSEEKAARLNARAVADKIMEQDGKLLDLHRTISQLTTRIALLEEKERAHQQQDFVRQAAQMGSGPTSE